MVVSILFRTFAVKLHFERMEKEKTQTTELKKTNGETILNQPETMLFQDACSIIEQAQASAYYAVNETLIKRNWLLGMRIQHEVLKDKRAEYGEQVVKNLAKKLSERYGDGFSRNNLYRDISFYRSHPDFFHAVSGNFEIVPSLTGQSKIIPPLMGQFSKADNLYDLLKAKNPIKLSWTHYSIILQENSAEARAWYEGGASSRN